MLKRKHALSARALRQAAHRAFQEKRTVTVTFSGEQIIESSQEAVIRAAVARKITEDLIQEKGLDISRAIATEVSKAWPDLTRFAMSNPTLLPVASKERNNQSWSNKYSVTVDILGLSKGALKLVFPEAEAG